MLDVPNLKINESSNVHGKNGTWIIHGGTRKIRIFNVMAVKITVHTLKCAGTHRNFSSATMNYTNAVFSMQNIRTWENHQNRK